MLLEIQGLTWHSRLHPRVGWDRALVLGEGRERAPTGSQEFWALPTTRPSLANWAVSLSWVRWRRAWLTPEPFPALTLYHWPPGLPFQSRLQGPPPSSRGEEGGTLSPSGVSKNSPQWGRSKGVGGPQTKQLPFPAPGAQEENVSHDRGKEKGDERLK